NRVTAIPIETASSPDYLQQEEVQEHMYIMQLITYICLLITYIAQEHYSNKYLEIFV
ncbi:hypothetical protein ACJX0J_029611, partial [Zea mays]